MNLSALKLLLLLTSLGFTAAAGSLYALHGRVRGTVSPSGSDPVVSSSNEDSNRGSGTEICARCGARREVKAHGTGPSTFVVSLAVEEIWSVPRIGACKPHCWQETGCWSSWSVPVQLPDGMEEIVDTTSCTMLAEKHVLWSALSKLDSAHADEMAKRFASLPETRQIELWRDSNESGAARGLTDRQIARAVAKSAGWHDLAAYWNDGPRSPRAR